MSVPDAYGQLIGGAILAQRGGDVAAARMLGEAAAELRGTPGVPHGVLGAALAQHGAWVRQAGSRWPWTTAPTAAAARPVGPQVSAVARRALEPPRDATRHGWERRVRAELARLADLADDAPDGAPRRTLVARVQDAAAELARDASPTNPLGRCGRLVGHTDGRLGPQVRWELSCVGWASRTAVQLLGAGNAADQLRRGAGETARALAAELGTALAELQPIEGTADAVTEQARAAGRKLRDLAESATWNLAPLLALGGLLYLISASNSRR